LRPSLEFPHRNAITIAQKNAYRAIGSERMANEGFMDLVNAAVSENLPSPAPADRTLGLIKTLPEEVRIALAHSPERLRTQLATFFALDNHLDRMVAHPREAALKQLRLAWWRDELAKPVMGGDAPHPLLDAVRDVFGLPFPGGVDLVDAWEAVAVADDLVAGAMALTATRTQMCFAMSGGHAGEVGNAVACWTFVGLAHGTSEQVSRDLLLSSALALPRARLPRSQRSLAILAGLARRAARSGHDRLLGDRLSPFAAIRLGIFGR